jgi:hypothetical protein
VCSKLWIQYNAGDAEIAVGPRKDRRYTNPAPRTNMRPNILPCPVEPALVCLGTTLSPDVTGGWLARKEIVLR